MQEASAGFRGHAIAAVCGSKGTGKSTFGRLLLNSLLNVCSEVAWLDTDCGQPEFTVPGLLSGCGSSAYKTAPICPSQPVSAVKTEPAVPGFGFLTRYMTFVVSEAVARLPVKH